MRATDLEVTSTGDLLYIDQSSDVVQRIHYTNPEPNQPPTAVATADALSGEAPVTVTFDGTGSTDPNLVDTLTYQWDLDGDGQFDDSVLAKPSFTYNAAGNYTVTLKVTDTAGASVDRSAPDRRARRVQDAEVHRRSPTPAWSRRTRDSNYGPRTSCGTVGAALPTWRATCASSWRASPDRCAPQSWSRARSATRPPMGRPCTR
jgi:hypothetical protein